jgi:hypothetical protein
MSPFTSFCLPPLWWGYSRGAIRDIKECAIANVVYGTGVLTITFLGGSAVIRTTGSVFRAGIIPIIATGVAPVVCVLQMAVWITLG